ncbi:hypothetical protein MMC16_000176 [Acarospora aff. strigata]|nr:hypothetical protein [Acarospora aff. strigata]
MAAADSSSKDVPKLLVLPENTSQHARVLSLCNPRSLTAKRYYFCPVKGLYEFTRLAAPKTAPRSCLIAPSHNGRINQEKPPGSPGHSKSETSKHEQMHHRSLPPSIADGHMVESTEILVATPFDPLFLVLSVLCPVPLSNKTEPSKQVFRSAEDLLDCLSEISRDFNYILKHNHIRKQIERRIAVVSDSVDAGDEPMYRLSNEKLLQELIAKAQRMVSKALPDTMEARFIRKALEVPIMSVRREDSSTSAITNVDLEEEASNVQSGTQTPSEGTHSQASISSSTTMESSASSAASISVYRESAPTSAPEGVPELLRLRSALSYMLSSYVPPHLSKSLNEALSSPSSPVDFAPLEKHLSYLSSLRGEALASRSLSDFSRKRGMNEDDEALETRAEKKRKGEEEEKRKKAGESRGVRDLKKVDTTGMKKLSDFFGKGATGKKKSK